MTWAGEDAASGVMVFTDGDTPSSVVGQLGQVLVWGLSSEFPQFVDQSLLTTIPGTGVFGPSSGASTDNAIVRWDGTTGKFIQDSLGFLEDSGKVRLPGSGGTSEVLLEWGDGSFKGTLGCSGNIPFISRSSVAGTFRFGHNADNPQWLLGNPDTDGGNVFIDSDSLTGGSREIRLNTLNGAGNGGAVVVGIGGLMPTSTAGDVPLGESARKFQRAEINHFVHGVDVFAASSGLDDATYVIAQDGTYTLTLPTAAEGWTYIVERQGSSGVVTLAADAGDTVNGSASISLTSDDAYLVFAEDATDWRAIQIGSVGDVTATLSLTNNRVIRGDGGAKGVQDSEAILKDDGSLLIRVDGAAFTSTYALSVQRDNPFSYIEILMHQELILAHSLEWKQMVH